jgi:hypothetical protein
MTSVAVLEAKIRFQNRRISNSSKQISLPLSKLRYSLITDKTALDSITLRMKILGEKI